MLEFTRKVIRGKRGNVLLITIPRPLHSIYEGVREVKIVVEDPRRGILRIVPLHPSP